MLCFKIADIKTTDIPDILESVRQEVFLWEWAAVEAQKHRISLKCLSVTPALLRAHSEKLEPNWALSAKC